ncbi:MAG: hypothetical protein K9G24_09760 [Candidatus Nanopelagicales bacterium]|nr:hypothetical protein [Candidatus Nanopelagicales bacterium]
MTTPITLGQFSTSPVVAAARHLSLDRRYGIDLTTTRVPSSPGQFQMLIDGAIDVAVTSPDNVLLYATTDRNPLSCRVDVQIVRAIDRGLGLTMVTRPGIRTVDDLAQASLCVDVVRSGFALLLFTMLDSVGIDPQQMNFEERGSTPARMEALLRGESDGTILNAESLVAAQEAGMRMWMTAADVSSRYLGTVLAVPSGTDQGLVDSLVGLWSDATEWLLDAPEIEVADCLGNESPILGSAAYVHLLRDPATGLSRSGSVDVDDLRVLCDIRRTRGAYSPGDDALAGLVRP